MRTRSVPMFPEEAAWLSRLRVGDPVVRWLGGTIPMPLKVTAVHGDRIECGHWVFSARNGAEIDPDIGWGEETSGSYIRPAGN